MANIGELSVGVKVDEGDLKKATKKVQTEFKKTGDKVERDIAKNVNGIGDSFAGIGGIIAGVFSIGAIVSFTEKLFSLGSDLEEVTSKFDVVFKGSQEVKQSFEDLAQVTNRSGLDLLTFGSGVGNVLAPLGLAQEEVNGLSLSLTQLAIDVASFNNVSDEQAVNAFTSALTGEREALKSLGIVILDADVKNRAYSLGLAKQGDQLTKQQTALSTYQLILENTANAQGDAIRTSDSFANQLKGLRGAIKDVFANSGKEVASETAGLLKKLTIFVSSYGEGIIKIITFTGKVIGKAIGEVIDSIGDLIGSFRSGAKEGEDNMNNFAFAFLKVVQGFGIGVKFIVTLIKNLASITGIVLNGIVEYWVASFKSITDGWNILKTIFIGTLKSIVDVFELGAEVIGQIFVGMAEAIVGVFKGIAENVAVGVKKATNLAIKGINGFIALANKIPGVNINKLVGFQDANFKPFELKIGKNIKVIKGKFKDFGDDLKNNYDGIGDSFSNISKNFGDATKSVVFETGEAVDKMSSDWGDFATDVQTSNDIVTKTLKDGADSVGENEKKYNSGFFNILDLIDKYKGSLDDATGSSKKQGETAKKTIDELEKQYEKLDKKIEDSDAVYEKYKDNLKQYNQEITDSINSIGKELEDVTTKYEESIGKIQTETGEDLANRNLEVIENIADTEKSISETKLNSLENEENKKQSVLDLQNKIALLELRISENTDKTSESTKQSQQLAIDKYNNQLKALETEGISLENQEKLAELEKQKTDLLAEQQFIVENTTEAQRKEAERVAGLSTAEKIKEDETTKIDEETEAFEKEKARLESLQRINKTFLDLKKLDEETLNGILASEKVKALSDEEQQLILKLARDKIQLTAQKDAIILQQQEIADATIGLSNSTTEIQLANISILKDEYANLINTINGAIVKQKELQAERKKELGFADGGYTGEGGKNDVAGVVHKGEWVAPKWMVNSMKPLFDNLESKRHKGFADGGYTSNVSKTQNNNITVNGGANLKSFIDYAKWKL